MTADPGRRDRGRTPAVANAATSAALEELSRKAETYFRGARAPNTLKAYRHDVSDFEVWCKVDAGGLSPLPAAPTTVALYLADLAGRGLKASTIRRRVASIAQLHQEAGQEDPTKTKAVKNTYRGIVREIGSYQEGKAPMLGPTVRRVLSAFSGDRGPAAERDRAILLLGLAGGYRVGELASLLVEDVEFEDAGAVVLLRGSKTDQQQAGAFKGIPHGRHPETCPVTHLRTWVGELRKNGRHAGPLFCAVGRYGNLRKGGMAADSVSRVVSKRARAAGLDPERYTGHSLRAGLVTGASEGGASDKTIMDQSKHSNLATVNRYKRRSGLFKNNAADYLGL